MLRLIFLMFLVFPGTVCAEELVLKERACEDKLIELIGTSKSHIDISVYAINNKRLVDAVIKAHNRGVKVRILTDKLQAAGRTSRVGELRRAGIPLKVNTRKRIMHTKVAIYDGTSVSSGSMNWTEPAVYKNEEVCDIFIDKPDYARQHQVLFDERWDENPKEKSDAWFKKRGG